MPECETCNGTGRVTVVDKGYLDRGSKWQRSYEYECTLECDDCQGTGDKERKGGRMFPRTIKLDCDQGRDDTWRVFCQNTGLELSHSHSTSEQAWAAAAEALAVRLSEVRSIVFKLSGG